MGRLLAIGLGVGLSVGLGVGLGVLALACEAGPEGEQQTAATASERIAASENLLLPDPHNQAILVIQDMGEIRLDLLPELAPETVANFIKLARTGFYDGTSFHRIIPDFMIQGGDPLTKDNDPRNDGNGDPGYRIKDEFSPLPHHRGTVSMANKGGRNSAGSQFFIVHQDSPHLDGKYTAFARVVEGIEVVDAITQVKIDKFGRYGPPNRPYPINVVIETIQIEIKNTQLGLAVN
jgi:peptidyl-prolyl cis-trans isomerase B (cyclophilin B)